MKSSSSELSSNNRKGWCIIVNFIISATTDIGIRKQTNQDSLTIKTIQTNQGRMVFALLCDGMGGLTKGEVASATVVHAFDEWVQNALPLLCNAPIEDYMIREQWEKIIVEQNQKIMNYGKRQGIRLGTTVVAMLITEKRYYIANVGDSRAYEITSQLKQLTVDQTFVEREVSFGHMTREQAERDERRSVLLQCCGSSDAVYPEMFFGETKTNAVYMLCSDGFRHEITAEEIYEKFRPDVLYNHADMERNTRELIELNKQRNEKDNISVAMARTF